MHKEFEKLQEENLKLRDKLALMIKEFCPNEQGEFFKLINELINNEVEQEKLCNQ